jgi:hypothetical protein
MLGATCKMIFGIYLKIILGIYIYRKGVVTPMITAGRADGKVNIFDKGETSDIANGTTEAILNTLFRDTRK